MLKRLISLLLAVMLLLGTSALADKNVNELIENALYRIVLRTDAGDSTLGSGVLFVESNVLLTPAACLQEGALYAIGTDGEYPITVASLLDDSGVAMMEIAALFIPNKGIKKKLCSLKYTPNTPEAVSPISGKPRKIWFIPKFITEPMAIMIIEGMPTARILPMTLRSGLR